MRKSKVKTGCRQTPSQRLELYAGKLARTVLRGPGVGNHVRLPNRGYRLLACGEPAQSGRSMKQEPTEATTQITA